MLTWQDLQHSELWSWFGVHEVSRALLPAGGVRIALKPGGFQEHIDLEVELSERETVRLATLTLDRTWIGEDGHVSPFASDITKSFLFTCAPDHGPAADLARRVERLMADAPGVIRRAAPGDDQLPPPSALLLEAIEVYTGRAARAGLRGNDAVVLLENVSAGGRQRLRVQVTAGQAVDRGRRRPWWRFWKRE